MVVHFGVSCKARHAMFDGVSVPKLLALLILIFSALFAVAQAMPG